MHVPTLTLKAALLGALAAAPVASATEMQAFQLNGYQLSGAEYWPFVADDAFAYPEDVLWGFYPRSAGDKVVACAEASYRRLSEFFAEDWPKMRRVVALGATPRFYLWTNDYTAASPDRLRRQHQMWHWNSGSHDYSQGYWKWEATLTQNAECLIPTDADIEAALDLAINALD